MHAVEQITGNGTVILGQPHGGTYVPEDVHEKLNDLGRGLSDTDWHIGRLYDGLADDLTIVRATVHRFVIDANRDPSGASLYPGQNTTGLCPTTDFDGRPIWQDGMEPDAEEVERRRKEFHAPYHQALEAEIARVKSLHGFAILYDCHSIRSDIPFLFESRLPVFNTGTNGGTTCASIIERTVAQASQEAEPSSHVLNGRFKGGWTTRYYGQPDQGVHAIQMELAQRSYMTEHPPWNYDAARADHIRPHLRTILERLNGLDPSLLTNP